MSVRSMLGTQTLLSMRQFIEDAEKEKGSLDAEFEVMDSPEAEQKKSVQHDAIKAWSSSDSQEQLFTSILSPQEYEDALSAKEPQLYLCDDWIQPVEVMLKPQELRSKEKARARVAKNCLLVTVLLSRAIRMKVVLKLQS